MIADNRGSTAYIIDINIIIEYYIFYNKNNNIIN